MGQVAGKSSSRKTVEKAKSHRTDPAPLDQIRKTINETGNVLTFRPAKGKLNYDRHVYAGDLSAEENSTVLQIRPLLTLEYDRFHHTAVVKHGVTGNILMYLVREPSDDPWHGTKEGSLRCSFGAETEIRLYANGRPVGVALGRQYMDVATAEYANGQHQAKAGASTVDLLRLKQRNSMVIARRKKDNKPGAQIAVHTKIRGGVAVLKVTEEDIVDPIVLLTMVWYVNVESS